MRSLFDNENFDELASELLKIEGMELAALPRKKLLNHCRMIARSIAAKRPDHTCTADDVTRALVKLGITPKQLGNAAGSVFKTEDWEFTGLWKASKRISNHSRFIRIWRLKA